MCVLIQYNKSNKIIEHVSTPVPTVDNIHIQIYIYMLCIHNRQKGTSIQTSIRTKSWTKYFIDRYLPCDSVYFVVRSLWAWEPVLRLKERSDDYGQFHAFSERGEQQC